MIQVIALRNGAQYTQPAPILTPDLVSLYKNHDKICAAIDEKERHNIFYTLAHHNGLDEASSPVRTNKSFAYQTVVAWDIDGVDLEHQQGYINIVTEVLGVDATSITIIKSGAGLHFILHLKKAIRDGQFFKENKPFYNEICTKISTRLLAAGLPGKADPVVFEPARIFRLPGSINRKPGRDDSQCELLMLGHILLDINLREMSGLGDIVAQNVPLSEIRQNYPLPDFAEIMSERGCAYLRHLYAHPEDIHEPDAFDAFSLLSNIPETEKSGDKTAKDIAAFMFENASSSRSLSRGIFDLKWEQAGRYGARKCTTIAERWEGCKSCPNYGKRPTPLAIKSSTHIGSEANGYWVINARGNYQHPHYEDLCKVFQKQHSFVTLADSSRMLGYTGNIYEPLSELHTKSWLDKTLSPTEPLRESHRNEFLAKIRAANVVGKQAASNIFDSGIAGKLNFRNGVLDIMTGDILPHSPQYGFLNCLPYDYEPGITSEFFMDWLETVCCHEAEMMEAVIDMMAYCLVPHYDDHVFAFLVGEGANGKSTLLHIMEALVGKDNTSSINIQQLTQNRFAPSALEGKMINLSEESSGKELGTEALNVLKTLSGGGTLFVEKKGEQGYNFQNKAKLIFSANKPPTFLEDSHAIKRRLLALHFKYRIETKDPRIEDRLCKQESPGIISMLVSHAREKIKEGQGVFRVSRGGRASEQAQKELLTGNCTVCAWAKESVESSVDMSDEAYMNVSDAYAAYTLWVSQNGFSKPKNKISFCRIMRSYVVTPATLASEVIRVGKASVRVFRKTRFKENAIS